MSTEGQEVETEAHICLALATTWPDKYYCPERRRCGVEERCLLETEVLPPGSSDAWCEALDLFSHQ